MQKKQLAKDSDKQEGGQLNASVVAFRPNEDEDEDSDDSSFHTSQLSEVTMQNPEKYFNPPMYGWSDDEEDHVNSETEAATDA